jgi:hypothetical protein
MKERLDHATRDRPQDEPSDGGGSTAADVAHADATSGSSDLEYPLGVIQAISSAAMGLLAILVAFIAYADFRLKPGAPWSWADVAPIVLALCAATCLAIVPLLATRPQRREASVPESAVHTARGAFAVGAACAILAIAWFVGRALLSHQV